MRLIRKPPSFRERSLRYAADVRKICKLWENSALYVLPHPPSPASCSPLLGSPDALVSAVPDFDHLQLHRR
jgi:hypothetical protein